MSSASWRGRSLNGDHPELRIDRQVDDILSCVDSIEASPGLVYWSLGADLALLAAAARSAAVAAVTPLEPLAGRSGTGLGEAYRLTQCWS